MQIPSVHGMFQAVAGSISSRLSLSVPAAAEDFASALEQAIGGAGAQGGTADYNLQQLTVEPDPAGSQASQTSAESSAAATTQTYYPTYSPRGSNGAPLYIPAVNHTTPRTGIQVNSQTSAQASKAQQVISYAEQFIGTPYVWGGEDLENGVDCSGFIQSVFKHFGVNLPRTAYSQSKVGTEVDPSNLQPGDLLFFKYSDRAPVTHVAMYIGDGRIIESSGKGVKITKMGNTCKTHLVMAKRIL